MKLSMTLFIIGLVGLPACSTNLADRSEESEPARFTNLEESLLSIIDFPEKSVEGTIIVRGAMRVYSNGKPGSFFIYSDTSDRGLYEPYELAVTWASRRAGFPDRYGRAPRSSPYQRGLKFQPAKFAGRRQDVWFNMSVVFTKTGESESVNIYPSLLYNIKEHGWRYSDPQRVIDSVFPSACRGFDSGEFVWIAASISSTGEASNARIVGGKARSDCEERLVELVLESNYIPARSGETFVEATFVEAWF